MDVVVVGSCMTDLISYASHLPKEGETLTGYKFSVGFGGKGANQCITAVNLGARVAMVGKLGDDTFGKEYQVNMHTNNVNCDHLKIVPGVSNGVASIQVADSGANCIVIVPGANNHLTVEDVNNAEDTIKNCRVLICQNEIPQDITLSAIKLAKKHNVKVIYNPAPASSSLLPELFSLPDYFCPNETEAEILIGSPIKTVEDAFEACKVLQNTKSCKSVIITLGEKGAVCKDESSNEAVHVSTTSVKAVDTTSNRAAKGFQSLPNFVLELFFVLYDILLTAFRFTRLIRGAGDSFIGSLAYFMAVKPSLSVPEMIKRACKIASISVQTAGTQTSFPKAKDLPTELLS